MPDDLFEGSIQEDRELVEFQWCEEIVVVPLQPRTAVYVNPRDQVVVRQEGTHPPMADNEDQFVFFSREHLPALIARLIEIRDGES